MRQRWITGAIALLLGAAFPLLGPPLSAAQPDLGVVTIRVTAERGAVEGARVAIGALEALTNERGEVTLRLAPGAHTYRVFSLGHRTATGTMTVRPGADTVVTVLLQPEALTLDAIIVSSTRTDRRIEDEPLRIEVIDREEIEEKLLMAPGDVAMLLNETAGLRVQPTAPTLGGAGVRIQGLLGRYTQILADGLPLYGGQTGALGPLQIPPMDLARVEVIKGAASALYGASALGGVINLISRTHEDEPEHELLLNQTTLGGTDVVVWSSAPLNESWGYTVLAGGHRQTLADVDDDGWADLPAFRRAVLRPRLVWDDGAGRIGFLTLGGMLERREGGTLPGFVPPSEQVGESLETRRADAGALARFLLDDATILTLRASGALQRHEHLFDSRAEDDRHRTGFAEVALTRSAGRHVWVIGAALQRDDFRSASVPGFDYGFTVPGIFAQDELTAAEWLTVAASARLDHHAEYGTRLAPRVSLLLRPGSEWSARLSAGAGYFAPTPWVEEVEPLGLGRLVPLAGLAAERARGGALDLARTFGDIELNATFFASRIASPVQVRTAPDDAERLELFNAAEAVRTHGTELLVRYHVEALHITATHVFLHATEPDPGSEGARRTVPLTPRHSAGLVAAWEQEDRGRFGAELYYTGRQPLAENPYRATSVPHIIVGFLVERHVGPARLFLNAENVLDTRQTRHDPLLLPHPTAAGRRTTDVWAPLDGRSFNFGVRWLF